MLVELNVKLNLDKSAYDTGNWTLEELEDAIDNSIAEVLSRRHFGDKWNHIGCHNIESISHHIINYFDNV